LQENHFILLFRCRHLSCKGGERIVAGRGVDGSWLVPGSREELFRHVSLAVMPEVGDSSRPDLPTSGKHEDVPSSVELRWRSGEHQAALTS
jgi:hypothetical protein